MDENRLKKLCKNALDMSYSGLTMTEFQVLPTHKFDEEKSEWIVVSHTLFIMLKKEPVDYYDPRYIFFENDRGYREVENFLEQLLGFETCVNFV